MTAAAKERFWQRADVLAVALFCVTLLLYAPAREFEFVSFDDHAFVDVPQIQRGLSWPTFVWSLTSKQAANWHPVTTLSLMADFTLYGKGPGGPHLTNVLLHSANAALVFLTLLALTRRRWPSWIVAALFAVHPMHVESVAWVAERKDLLSSLFFFLTILAYERFARSGRGVMYGLALLAFALGLMSKPMIVTLPCVLLMLDVWPLNLQARWGRLILEKVPFFAMAATLCVITMRIQTGAGAMPSGLFPLSLRLQNVIYAYGRYLWTTIWPAKLAVFYPYFGFLPGTKVPIAGIVGGACVILLITVGCLMLWRREKAALIGWLWFLGMLVPVIGLVQVGMQSMADRYAYLPHVGLFMAIVWLRADAIGRFKIPPAAVAAGCVVVFACLAYRTTTQLSTWHDTESLFNHALTVTSHNHVAHNNLAYVAMQDPARQSEAESHLKLALAINPKNREPYYNMGLLLDGQGKHREAQSWFEQAIALDPYYANAYLNLANTLLAEKRYDEAIANYRKAISLEPEHFLAHYNLGLAISQRDGDAAALDEFKRAVELSPDHAEASYSYALALLAAGREAEAVAQFSTAARLAQEQRLDSLSQAIAVQQNASRALPKPTTNPENPRP